MGAVATIDSYIFVPPQPASCDAHHKNFVRTGHHHGAFLIRPRSSTSRPELDGCIIYFHANACDCSSSYNEMRNLVRETNCIVLAPEYPGYGLLQGTATPSIAGTNDAAHYGYKYARDILGMEASDIVLFGRSIGTGPAMHLARELGRTGELLGAIVLSAPFESLERMVTEKLLIWKKAAAPLAAALARSRWDSGEAMATLRCPVLLVHGAQDDIIPIAHSVDLAKRNPLAEVKCIPGWNHDMRASGYSAIPCDNLESQTVPRLTAVFLLSLRNSGTPREPAWAARNHLRGASV